MILGGAWAGQAKGCGIGSISCLGCIDSIRVVGVGGKGEGGVAGGPIFRRHEDGRGEGKGNVGDSWKSSSCLVIDAYFAGIPEVVRAKYGDSGAE